MTPAPVTSELLTVLICSYNHAQYLPAAMESILSQSVLPEQILLLDDGSTDHTADIAATYADKVAYHKLPHGGLVAARNKGLELVQTEWFAILDADNLFDPGYLEIMDRVIRNHGEDSRFAMAIPSRRYFGFTNAFREIPEFSPALLRNRNIVDANSVYRTSAAREVGYDPGMLTLEDHDHGISLVRAGYQCRSVPDAVLAYRTHSTSVSAMHRSLGTRRKMRKRLLAKHREWFSDEEAATFEAKTRKQHLFGLIYSRTPASSWISRLRSVIAFAVESVRHGEFIWQGFYWLFPQQYFTRRVEPAEVFYLYKDTPVRREQLNAVLHPEDQTLPRDQLAGIDAVEQTGIRTYSNLHLGRTRMDFENFWYAFDHRYTTRTGIGLGDHLIVRAFLWQIRRASLIVTCSDTVGLPALRIRQKKALTNPLLYVSIGLPEKIQEVSRRNPQRADRYRQLLQTATAVVAYGWEETQWLKDWLGSDTSVHFIPFGVDTAIYNSEASNCSETESDVLAVGADPLRDFGLLLETAKALPGVSFHFIASSTLRSVFSTIPMNVRISYDLPRKTVMEAMAGCKVVALPVKENTYSGATTTLLQAMAMNKAVMVSRTGAIRDGYGLEDRNNCLLLPPGDNAGWTTLLPELLNDQDLRTRIGLQAGKHVRTHLNWEATASRIRELIEQYRNPS